jgi:predicted ester cyclase
VSEDKKEVVLEFYRRWDSADPSWNDIVSDDFKVHFGGIPRTFQREDMDKFNKAFWDCFADRKHAWEIQLVEGDIVASRGTYQATCTGQFGGDDVKGKKLVLDALTHHRVVEGKVTEEWLCVTPRVDLDLPPNGEPMTSLLAAVLPTD